MVQFDSLNDSPEEKNLIEIRCIKFWKIIASFFTRVDIEVTRENVLCADIAPNRDAKKRHYRRTYIMALFYDIF